MDEDSREMAWGTEAESQNSVCHMTEWGTDNYESLMLEIFKMVLSVQKNLPFAAASAQDGVTAE